MKPQIKDIQTWNQAELLMQPAFIRLIDNFRKAVEASDWEARYDNLQAWPEGATEAQKARWNELSAILETTQPVDLAAIEAELATLPAPELSYRLNLERGDRTVQFDLWQLCYQVCFRSYIPSLPSDLTPELAEATQVVEIDEQLIDSQGEVDWAALDRKTQGLVVQLLANLS